MLRTALPILFTVVSLGLTIYALADAIRTEDERVKALPKIVWILLIILVPIVGPIVWIWVGKERASREPSSFDRPQRGPVAPDDDPRFLAQLDLQLDHDQRLRDLERRLEEPGAASDSDGSGSTPDGSDNGPAGGAGTDSTDGKPSA